MTFKPTPGRLFLFSGPCVIESLDQCLLIARELKSVCAGLGIDFAFKASFDKANRSSGGSFRGPGLTDGLVTLERVQEDIGVPVVTDVHEPEQAEVAGKVVDVLQIPAFLARQTDLLVAAGLSKKCVHVKKGQFMSPAEMKLAVDKLKSTGNTNLILCERGTFFGYNRLVNDFGGLPTMKANGFPVSFDVSHSTQQPAGLGNSSGGDPTLSPLLAHAAIAAGYDGLFIECHPDPKNAKSDAATVLDLKAMPKLLEQCAKLFQVRKGF